MTVLVFCSKNYLFISRELNLYIGLVSIVAGIVVLLQLRVGFARPLQHFFWSVPFLFASPFLIVAAVTGRTSHITLSADTGTLTVQKTLLSAPVGSREYPLAQVRVVKVGVGNVCRFLYISLVDQPAENLTSCTDRTGYSEAADAINAFLVANRRPTPQGTEGLSRSIL